jgi:hypothetical protein
MSKGKKVAHSGFTPDEWMKAGDYGYEFEDGCKCIEQEFWNYRTEDYWLTGWSIK